MPWYVNEDKPDWTTIHRTTSTDRRCQPQEKRVQDGQWHTCQTEQELLDLIPIVVGRSGSKVRTCGICRPVVPAAVQPFITDKRARDRERGRWYDFAKGDVLALFNPRLI